MLKHMRNFTVLVLFLLSSTLGRANVQLPDSFGNDHTKIIEFLLSVQHEIPWMFQEGAQYDVDLFGLLQANDQFVSQLREDQTFKKLTKLKGSYIDIEVSQVEEQKSSQSTLTENFIATFANEARRIGEYVGANLDQPIKEAQKINHRGVVTGLIGLIPSADEKKRLYEIGDIESKAEELFKSGLLTPEVLKSFDGTRVGLPMKTATSEQLRDFVEKGAAVERDLILKAFLLFFRQSGFWDINKATPAEISLHIQKFFQPNSREVAQYLPSDKKSRKYLVDAIEGYAKSSAVKTSRTENVKKVLYVLREVPPVLGIFRGLVGNDCATQSSFPFPYMPGESTFFIYDANDRLKGYAALTDVVGDDGEKYWYAHDVTGNYMSPDAAILILHALKKAAKEKGFKGIVMPTPQRIHANNNHVSLGEAQQKMVKQGAVVGLSYVDAPIRNSITRFQAGNIGFDDSYDSENSNRQAMHPIFNDDLSDSIEVSLIKQEPWKPKKAKLNKQSGALLVLSVLTSSRLQVAVDNYNAVVGDIIQGAAANYKIRQSAAQVIANVAGLDYRELLNLSKILQNPNQASVEDYYLVLTGLFEKFDIQIDQNLLHSYSFLFEEGHLNSADPFATQEATYLALSHEYVLKLILRWPQPTHALELIVQHATSFAKMKQFKKLARDLMRGDAQDWDKLSTIATSPELLESMLKVAAAVDKNIFEKASDLELGGHARALLKKLIKVAGAVGACAEILEEDGK